MDTSMLPQDIIEEIEEQFGYRPDHSYQDRAHEYMEDWGLTRTANDTAVQVEVTHLCLRAYEAGLESEPLSLKLKAELLETAAKCVSLANTIED